MFNTKEIHQLREEVTKKLEDINNDFASKLSSHSDSIKQLNTLITEMKQSYGHNTEKLRIDMFEIAKLKSEFESALRRIQSTSRIIEDRAADSVREVAEKEINTINASSQKFRELEDELKQIVNKVNLLNQEIAKFTAISQQIKLVDFTLKKHQEEIRQSERERTNLLEENERLKTIMAKIKRNRF